jgi:hypothetical protein
MERGVPDSAHDRGGIDRRDLDMTVGCLAHHDIAWQHHADVRLRKKRGMGDGRIAGAENPVERKIIDPEFRLHGRLDIDVAENAETFALEGGHRSLNRGVEIAFENPADCEAHCLSPLFPRFFFSGKRSRPWSRFSITEDNEGNAQENETNQKQAEAAAAHSPTHAVSHPPSLTHHRFSPSIENSYTFQRFCEGSEITHIWRSRALPGFGSVDTRFTAKAHFRALLTPKEGSGRLYQAAEKAVC